MSPNIARRPEEHPAIVAYDNAPEDTSGEVAPPDLEHRLATLDDFIPHADVLEEFDVTLET